MIFYLKFYQNNLLLFLILKTIKFFGKLALKIFKNDNNKNFWDNNNNRANKIIKNLSKFKKLKNKKYKNLMYI